MAVVYDKTTFKLKSTTTPNYSLLKNDCIGCHFGTNDGTNKTPYVLSSAEPNYGTTGTGGTTTTLAGGNFYWVGNGNDSMGHNVVNITTQVSRIPPGGSVAISQLGCAGLSGCHGDRTQSDQVRAMRQTHHPLITNADINGSSPDRSYRFLNGIVGYEDSDWEFRPTTSAHNQYKGEDRASEVTNPTDTISHFCAICHGNFHNGSGKISSTMRSPWLRHPTDFDFSNLSAGAEALSYDGDSGTGGNQYDVVVPLASSSVASVKTNVFFSDDTIITCITCHRAHGTPFYKMLRWNYASATLSTALDGCVRCHTSKN